MRQDESVPAVPAPPQPPPQSTSLPTSLPASLPAPTRSVRVRIASPDGAGGSLRVWWGPGRDAVHGTVVMFDPDASGEMVLDGLPAEPVTMCALADGFVVPTTGLPRAVVPAHADSVELVLDRGTSRAVRVRGWRPGAFGLAYLAAADDIEPSQHGVQRDGTLVLDGLRPGVTYNLFVRDSENGRSALLRGLSFGADWPEIEVAPAKDVTGRVLLPEGRTMAVVALLVDKAVLIDGGPVREDGSFTVEAVPDGTYTLVAYTSDEHRYLAGTAKVVAGGTVTIDLRPDSDR